MAGDDEVAVTVTLPGRQRLVVLLEEELVIGRECDGLIIPDSEVSRQHLKLRRRGRAVEVSDMRSTNGSYLDGARLTDPQLIDTSANLAIGDTNVHIEFRSSAHAPTGLGRATEVRTDDLRRTSIDLLAEAVASGPNDGADTDLSGDTITMVFSDIESSTERAARLGDRAWFQLLEVHNRIFRDELQRWDGHEVKSMGDGFMLTFPSVRKALEFTAAVQRVVMGPDGPDLKVRMGVHTGEAITDNTGDLFGRHVIIAARVANLASGGQILTTVVVREIASGQDNFRFSEPTMAELKGFPEKHDVFELLWEPAG